MQEDRQQETHQHPTQQSNAKNTQNMSSRLLKTPFVERKEPRQGNLHQRVVQTDDPPIQTREGKLGPIQSKQSGKIYQTKEGKKPPIQAKQRPIQRQRSNNQDNLIQRMESQHGVDLSHIKETTNSSFPATVGAVATNQGGNIHYSPGQNTLQNRMHEIGHEIVNAQRGTPPIADAVVNGQAVNTSDEAAADKIMNTPVQAKGLDKASLGDQSLIQTKGFSGVIQRLTGYEAETRIPIFGTYNMLSNSELPDRAKKGFTDELGLFISGGLKYGLAYSKPFEETDIEIKADHADLMIYHHSIVKKLISLGMLPEDFSYDFLTILEYVTPARTEFDQNGLSLHQKDMAHIKQHHNATLPFAQNNYMSQVPSPAYESIYTGVPRNAFFKWFKACGISIDFIRPELDKLQSAIDDKLYMQETSGVLPEDIPLVFNQTQSAMEQAQPGISSSPQKQTASKYAQNILKTSVLIADKTVQEFASILGSQAGSIKGYLTLLASYVLSDKATQSEEFGEFLKKSNEKNWIPFMSKVNLKQALKALPPQAVELLQSMPKIINAFISISEEMSSFLTVKSKASNGKQFTAGLKKTITEDLLDKNDDSINVKSQPGMASFLNLDEPHQEVEKRTQQKAIPLEDRYFNYQYETPINITNFEQIALQRFLLATKLQKSHLSSKQGSIALEQNQNDDATLSKPQASGLSEKLAQLKYNIQEMMYDLDYNEQNESMFIKIFGEAFDSKENDDGLSELKEVIKVQRDGYSDVFKELVQNNDDDSSNDSDDTTAIVDDNLKMELALKLFNKLKPEYYAQKQVSYRDIHQDKDGMKIKTSWEKLAEDNILGNLFWGYFTNLEKEYKEVPKDRVPSHILKKTNLAWNKVYGNTQFISKMNDPGMAFDIAHLFSKETIPKLKACIREVKMYHVKK